jgi:hypothetical protein
VFKRYLSAGIAFVGMSAAVAENLDGETHLLCAPGAIMHCSSDGVCDSGPPENYDIPRFVEIDLERKLMMTPESASGAGRSTPIQFVTRAGGEIYLQGVENGRAYSLLIVAGTGDATLAIASMDDTATAFAACTAD